MWWSAVATALWRPGGTRTRRTIGRKRTACSPRADSQTLPTDPSASSPKASASRCSWLALIGRPELLLLDEPAAGLDLGARERLVSRLGELAVDPRSPTTVLVTHHCEEIPRGFTHAGLMRNGRLLAAGPLDDVLSSSLVSACFDVPVTVGRQDGRWWSRAAE